MVTKTTSLTLTQWRNLCENGNIKITKGMVRQSGSIHKSSPGGT